MGEHDGQGEGEERVTRLEENAAFTERTIEQLSEEVLEVNRRMKQLVDRLEGLEGRLSKMLEGGAEEQPGE